MSSLNDINNERELKIEHNTDFGLISVAHFDEYQNNDFTLHVSTEDFATMLKWYFYQKEKNENYEAIQWNEEEQAIADKLYDDMKNQQNKKDLYVDRWRVHILEKGDSYGAGDCLTWDKDELAVEFYDMNANKESFPKGQFTGGRYYMSTLLKLDEQGLSLEEQAANGRQLSLYGEVPEWTVNSDSLRVIAAWLEVVNKNIEGPEEKLFYSGDVDVPFDVIKEYDLNYPEFSVGCGKDIVESRLKAIPEFTDVSVEYMGNYNNGHGYSVSFAAVVIDVMDADILLSRAMSDLKFDVCCENGKGSLDNTLKDAVERSGEGTCNKGTIKKEME